MNNPDKFEDSKEDEALDRLLGRLVSAEVDAGFSKRVVSTVQARVTSAKRPVFLAWQWSAAFAATVLIAVLAGSSLGHRKSTPTVIVAHAPAQSVPVIERVAVLPARLAEPGPSRRKRVEAVLSAHVETSDEQAFSFPAPVEPLTEQEQLLRRIAHTGDRVELAALNPELRDSLFARDRQETDRYFYKPPLIDADGNVITKNLEGGTQ